MAHFPGMEPFVCCICGVLIRDEWGNNPSPVNDEEGAKCCDVCDRDYVIPARIRQIMIPANTGRR